MMMKSVLLLLWFLYQCRAEIPILFSSPWYGSFQDIQTAQRRTVDLERCTSIRSYNQPNDFLSMSSFDSINTRIKDLKTMNLNYTIGERNEFLQFIYLNTNPDIIPITPLYPNDDEIMSVVFEIFSRVTNNASSNIVVIINRTQDYNNFAINNYQNFILKINQKNWANVKFLQYISAEDVIYKLRLRKYFNVISLLSDPSVNEDLIKKIYLAHLMVWKYKWVIVDLLGGKNVLNDTFFGKGTLSNNVVIITFGQNDLSGRSILLESAFNITISVGCNKDQRNTLSGDFKDYNRTNFKFAVYVNPGFYIKGPYIVTYNRNANSVSVGTMPNLNFVLTNVTSKENIKATGLRIGFIEYPPYSMTNGTSYYGFTIDLLTNILSKIPDLNITPVIVPLSADKIGNFNSTSLTYSGLLALVQNGTVDTVSVPITLTPNRINNFDFAANVLTGYITGAYYKPQMIGLDALINYVKPFDNHVWIILGCSAVAIAIALAITDYCFPDKFARYKILMSLFFAFSSLTHGAYLDPPKRTGGRIVMCFWWLFCLFIIIIWMSNYTALLAKDKTQLQLSNFKSLLGQNSYNMTTVNDNLLYTYLQNNPYKFPRTLYRIMNEETTNGTVDTIADAVSLVKTGKYIFLYDDKTLSYYSSKNCFTMFGKFIDFEYGIVLPKYSEKTPFMTDILTASLADGNTTSLRTKYFYVPNPNCISPKVIDQIAAFFAKIMPNTFPGALNANFMIGVIMIMVVGGTASLLLASIEKLIRFSVVKVQQRREKYKYETTVEQLQLF